MTRFTLAALLLGLAACTTEAPNATEASDDILAMSRTAVDESAVDTAQEPAAPVDLEVAEVAVTALAETTTVESPVPADTIASEEVVNDEVVTGTAYVLRRGETLAHFARWSNLPVEEIAEASGLDLAGTYDVGTDILVPVAAEDVARLESLREEHSARRVTGYLASRGGSNGTDVHVVKTGETAWGIARNNQGIPLWLLESYNPSVELGALRPGDRLVVPLLNDSVAAAEDDDLLE